MASYPVHERPIPSSMINSQLIPIAISTLEVQKSEAQSTTVTFPRSKKWADDDVIDIQTLEAKTQSLLTATSLRRLMRQLWGWLQGKQKPASYILLSNYQHIKFTIKNLVLQKSYLHSLFVPGCFEMGYTSVPQCILGDQSRTRTIRHEFVPVLPQACAPSSIPCLHLQTCSSQATTVCSVQVILQTQRLQIQVLRFELKISDRNKTVCKQGISGKLK